MQGPSVLQCAYQETLDGRLIAVSASAVAGAVIVYAVLGPMGMEDNLGPLQRLAFVGTVCALCWPLCHAFSATVLYLARVRPPIQILAFAVAGVLFMAIPCSAVAYAFYGLFDPDGAARDEILETYLNVAVLLAICSSLVHYAACQRVKLKRARATNLDTPGRPRNRRRRPLRARKVSSAACRPPSVAMSSISAFPVTTSPS